MLCLWGYNGNVPLFKLLEIRKYGRNTADLEVILTFLAMLVLGVVL